MTLIPAAISAALDAAALETCRREAEQPCRAPLTFSKLHAMRGSAAVASLRKKGEKHSRSCVTPVATAVRLANGSIARASNHVSAPVPKRYRGDGTPHGRTEWNYIPALLDMAVKSPLGCVVYAFGVAGSDEFTNFYSSVGCHVYAFDPTVKHPLHWRPNVTFHPWGLRSTESSDGEVGSIGHYGAVGGQLHTLPDIMQKLGHGRDRPITALKLDCEGCILVLEGQQLIGSAYLAFPHLPEGASTRRFATSFACVRRFHPFYHFQSSFTFPSQCAWLSRWTSSGSATRGSFCGAGATLSSRAKCTRAR